MVSLYSCLPELQRVCCKGSAWKSTRPCIGSHAPTVRLLRIIKDTNPILADYVDISRPMVGIPCLGLASACPRLWDWWEEDVGHQGLICLAYLNKGLNLICLVGREVSGLGFGCKASPGCVGGGAVCLRLVVYLSDESFLRWRWYGKEYWASIAPRVNWPWTYLWLCTTLRLLNGCVL